MTAASAPPVTDPQAPSGSMAAPGIADKVRAQLLGDYPPSALSWIDGIRWTGPVQVPVSQVDRSTGDTDWAAAAKDRAKLALFRHKIAGGFRKPVVLVRTPGGGKLFAIDGHTRVLACMALGVPVAAWVGTAASEHGPWEQAHSRQLANDGRAVDLATAPGLTSRSGMISLDLPDGTIKPVPGGLSDHHVTVVYLGPDLDDAAFAAACARAKDAAASASGPLTGTVSGVSSFTPSPGSEGKVPAFAPASIPGAKDLRSKLEDLSASEHKDWVPHVTLAYIGKGDPLPTPLPRTSVKFTHLSVHRGDEVKRFPLGGSEHANDSPALDLSAQTAALEVTPAPYGRPDGPGLYGVKGQKHSDYFEQIVRAMMLKGKTKAEASAMAWGILRRWAAGGGKVHPEVRAAAAAALAEEAAKSGRTHVHANDPDAIDLAGMFTESLHPRIGGKFASKGGTPVAQARARNAPKGAAPAILPGGTSTRSQQLRYQASQDRQLAHQVMIKIAALVRARDAAIAGISPGKASTPVNAAKSAAAKKAALTRKTGTAKAKAKTAVRKTTGTKKTRVQRLNGQIKLLKNDARLLLKAANHLDTEAAKS